MTRSLKSSLKFSWKGPGKRYTGLCREQGRGGICQGAAEAGSMQICYPRSIAAGVKNAQMLYLSKE